MGTEPAFLALMYEKHLGKKKKKQNSPPHSKQVFKRPCNLLAEGGNAMKSLGPTAGKPGTLS